jgi:predicted GTPase
MGWCTGSYICDDIWQKIRDYIPEEQRVQILADMISRFSDEDADCWNDVMHNAPEYREALILADLEHYLEDEDLDE